MAPGREPNLKTETSTCKGRPTVPSPWLALASSQASLSPALRNGTLGHSLPRAPGGTSSSTLVHSFIH